MNGTATAYSLVASLQRVDVGSKTADDYLVGVSAQVGKAVPFDGGLWFGVDPSTMLASALGRVERLEPSMCLPFWNNEFHDNDVLQFRNVARQTEPVGSLLFATEGKPARSPRYREILRPQGYEHEARVAFRTGNTTWGVAALYRERGRPPFEAEELKLLATVSRTVGVALRTRSVLNSPAGRAMESLRAPGVLLLDAKGGLISANLQAKAWLRQIYAWDLNDEPWSMTMPASEAAFQPWTILLGLMSQARAVALGYEDGPAQLRCKDREGRWAVLHASCMDENDPASPIAVVIEPAQSAEVAPIIVEAYGLTVRERDVLRGIACGLSTPEIAGQLFLSVHTVRDHIKSVFEKVGVKSRGELTAKIFAEHYFDAFHTASVMVD